MFANKEGFDEPFEPARESQLTSALRMTEETQYPRYNVMESHNLAPIILFIVPLMDCFPPNAPILQEYFLNCHISVSGNSS